MAKMKFGKAGSKCSQADITEAIRKKARELYEKSGRRPGRDMDNWLEAERMVKAQMRNDVTHMPC